MSEGMQGQQYCHKHDKPLNEWNRCPICIEESIANFNKYKIDKDGNWFPNDWTPAAAENNVIAYLSVRKGEPVRSDGHDYTYLEYKVPMALIDELEKFIEDAISRFESTCTCKECTTKRSEDAS